MRTLQADLHLI